MNRLIIVSNRLPFALDSMGEDLWTVTPAAGGLVSAVEPVLRERGGTWIGWPGTAGEIPKTPFAEATRGAGYKVVPVALSETERDEFYYGYSNEVIWPLFHDLQNFCNFEPGYWQTYKAVNDRFADAIARCAQPNDFIWVRNFLGCVRRVMSDARVVPRRGLQLVRFEKRQIRLGHFPIGIDFDAFEKGAMSDAVAHRSQQLRANFRDCQLILGVDRLDYSKGIPERL